MNKERILAAVMLVMLAMFLSGCANMKTQWVINLSYESDNVAADVKMPRSGAEKPKESFDIKDLGLTSTIERVKAVQREQSVLSIAK